VRQGPGPGPTARPTASREELFLVALLPFAHRIGIARRDVGEFLVAADLRRDLPGAGAFASLSRLEDDGDTLDVIETEGISRSFAFDARRIGADRHLRAVAP